MTQAPYTAKHALDQEKRHGRKFHFTAPDGDSLAA
jgi:hypothetical protein